MKKIVSSLLVLSLFAAIACANTWAVAPQVLKSIVYLEHSGGSCTGFVINTEKNYILTAAHCDGKELFADQSPAKVISKDVKSDLMVIQIEDLDRPALKLATQNPIVGDEVASIGFGYGFDRPMFRATHVSDGEAQIPEESGTYVMLDSAFVPGQSGGPVVDLNGNVVAIVQLSNERVAFGRGAEEIKRRVGKYFGK
jgi:S1-C subfamily serine protease